MKKVYLPDPGAADEYTEQSKKFLILEDDATLSDVIYCHDYSHYCVLVNFEYKDDNYVLKDGDKLQMLPTGG